MKETEKTNAQNVAERIRKMPLHKEYKPVPNIPIPLFKGILIKKTKKGEVTTKSGIIMAGVKAENVIDPHEGIIVAVGPMCSEFTRVGLKYKFSHYVDSYYYHDGEEYMMADETLLHYIVPSDEFIANAGYKTAKQVRHTKKLAEQTSREVRIAARDANEEDMRKDTTKGKIRKVK